MLNEILIHCKDHMLPCLHKLFNTVFNSGFFLQSWTQQIIIPVYKKSNGDDPNNYRGITIVSCLEKLFTSILNKRLLNWDKHYTILTDTQFGFRPGVSTTDAIYVLQSLINRTLYKNKRLYCCFFYYKKAFDFINRNKLWSKLIVQGVQGNIVNIMKSLYVNIKSCVKFNGYFVRLFY